MRDDLETQLRSRDILKRVVSIDIVNPDGLPHGVLPSEALEQIGYRFHSEIRLKKGNAVARGAHLLPSYEDLEVPIGNIVDGFNDVALVELGRGRAYHVYTRKRR